MLWSNTALEQIGLNASQRLAVEGNLELIATIADAFDVALWRQCEVDDLAILEGIKTMIVELNIPQQHHDNLFSVVLGFADLSETFWRR